MSKLIGEMDMNVDLRKLTAKQALALAKAQAGITNAEIAERAELPRQTVEQYFKASGETYFPSLSNLPDLCRALGNTILLDWIHAQLEDPDQSQELRSGVALFSRVTSLGSALGAVCSETDEALKDGKLDGQEAQRICGAAYTLEKRARELRDGLAAISGQRFVPGKGFVMVQMEECA